MNSRTINYRLPVCLVLTSALSTAMAETSSFRCVDESARLPLDTNPPNTDTLK